MARYTLLLGILTVQTAQSFQLPLGITSFPCTTSQRNVVISSSMQGNNDNSIGLSPPQIKMLRKEASKRKARSDLTRYPLPLDESFGPFSIETLKSISELLHHHELVEVRAISKGQKRMVYDASEQLAFEVAMELGREVFVIDIKGFSATLYCPGGDDMVGRIRLRTSYQPGAWTKRPKPKRDNRGKVIKE